VSEWQPIETAPKGKLVLIYYPESADARGRNHLNEWITVNYAPPATPRKATHWAPIPELPK
jgi:hypothetical protein